MTSPPEPSLILWDIDHTLVRITGVSREIYAEAFRLVTGQPLRELADIAGPTERAIIVDTLILNALLTRSQRSMSTCRRPAASELKQGERWSDTQGPALEI